MPLRRLPSLTALRAFEAAARRLSFKSAATELSVTPSAVSQKIRALEADLDVTLFERTARSVALTDEGRQLQPDLTAAFLQIRQAVDRVRPSPLKSLRINSSGAVIAKWLLPRLHRFTERHPELDVSVETDSALVDMSPGGPDIVIRFTRSLPETLYARRLHEELLIPVASLELIERLDLRTPKDILRTSLLHDTSLSVFAESPNWNSWFRAAGLAGQAPRTGVRFARQAADHAIDAAVSGTGVALARSLLVHGALSDGRLVSPFGPVLCMGVSYFVACRHGAETEPHIADFLDWAEEEAALLSTLKSLHMATG